MNRGLRFQKWKLKLASVRQKLRAILPKLAATRWQTGRRFFLVQLHIFLLGLIRMYALASTPDTVLVTR